MKTNMIEGAMRSFPMLAFTIIIIIALGFYALPHLNKNEFPSVAIKQGVVAVIYPGATAEEIEEQVAGKVEDYLFTFTDVDKTKTYSYSKNGMLYIFVSLVHSDGDPKVTWSRIREGLTLFRITSLPQGVVATAVIDDFGDASSLLLAIESKERSPRELEAISQQLSAKLRSIPEMGRKRRDSCPHGPHETHAVCHLSRNGVSRTCRTWIQNHFGPCDQHRR